MWLRDEICALSSSDDVRAPWAVCGRSSWLFAPANFVTGGDCATIQNTAQLAKLAYGSFEVNDPLGWDWHALSSSLVAASTSLVLT